MPDMEIEELIGPGLEPTDAFVSSLREQIAGEWHGVTAAPVAARRRWPRVMIAAASVAAVVGGVVFVAGRDDRQHTVTPAETSVSPPQPPQIRRISTITFDTPTDAWVASNGLAALYRRDDQWFLGEYDAKGRTGETPVDVVGDGPEHTVSVFPEDAPTIGMITPGGVVIDGYVYAEGVDGWAKGACWACAADMLAPPTASSDGQGQLTAKYGGSEWSFAAPARVDDQPEVVSIGSATEPAVGVLAHIGDSTVLGFGRPDASTGTAVVAGKWMAVGTQRNGMLARTPDPARLDYSVSLIPWPTIDDANGYERVATIAMSDSTVTWVGRSGKLALYSRAGVAMVGIFDSSGLVAETSLGVAAPAGGMSVESNLDDTLLSVNGVSFSLADGDWRRCTECFTGDLLAGSATVTLDEADQLWDIGWNGERWQIPFADSTPGVQPVAVVVRGEAVAFSVPTKSGGLMYALLRPGRPAAVARLADTWVAVGADLDGLLARRVDQTNHVFSVDRIPWPTSPNDGRVATITFDRPTKAWVGNSGRQALVHDEDGWWVAQYDEHGRVARQPVDGEVTDGSTFADTGGLGVMDATHVVIDHYFYALVDGSWRRGVSLATAYWMPDLPPVVENTGDGFWTVRPASTTDSVRVPVPADAIGPVTAVNVVGGGLALASASSDADVALRIVAVRGGSVSTFAVPADGIGHRLLGGTGQGALVQRVGSERDYSVDLVPWPADLTVVDGTYEPGVLYVQPSAAVLAWFVVDATGNRVGFDGCNRLGVGDGTTDHGCDEMVAPPGSPIERFDAAPAVTAGALAGSWRGDTGGLITFQRDGTVGEGACDGQVGTWTLGQTLQVQESDGSWSCLAGDDALRSVLSAGAATSLRPDGSLWLATDEHVVRLRPVGRVGDDVTPAAGGQAIAMWSSEQLRGLGVSLDELHVGMLDDGNLAALIDDGSKILVIDAAGTVLDTVTLPAPQQQLLVHPGDVAELVAADAAHSWVSLSAGHRGEAVAPLSLAMVEGAGCFWVIGIENGRSWTIDERECNMAVEQPFIQPDGSVLLTGSATNPDNSSVEISATGLSPDGAIRSVVLGHHAVDGSEGWIRYQPTPTGGLVLFHYPDDTVALYRYTFPV